MAYTPISQITTALRSMGKAAFDAAMGAFYTQLPSWVDSVNVAGAQIDANATTAAGAAVQAAASAAAAQASANVPIWVSGTTYAINDRRYSPITGLTYRRMTAGAGTTDPSLDTTNWAAVVPQSIPRTPKSANYTILASDRNAHIDYSGDSAPRTLSYTAAASLGNGFEHWVSAGQYPITLGFSDMVQPFTSVLVACNGTGFDILARSQKNGGRIAAPIGSSATLNLDNVQGDVVHVTGTATISAITLSAGARKIVIFDAAPTLVSSGTLVIPGASNLVVSPGFTCEFIGESAGVVRMGMDLTRPGEELVDAHAVTAASANYELISVFNSALNASTRSATICLYGITRSAASSLLLQLAYGGTTVDTASGNYSDPLTTSGVAAGSAVGFTVTNASMSAAVGVTGEIKLHNLTSSDLKFVDFSTAGKNSSGFIGLRGAGAYDRAVPVTGFRLSPSTGTLSGGFIAVYARRGI